ncbi:hypothetical protein [Runella salmonicolor]|uniref:Uncharacterized protein n=1 Tax=Runella salmonicolor TaxID=2950278 RepID=A0ABT1FP14_9BACT|nr:hypothetical protein [Runella salmonicolor]MCP1383471.1 hypothetical protein [Runella salmonicolor]
MEAYHYTTYTSPTLRSIETSNRNWAMEAYYYTTYTSPMPGSIETSNRN